MKVVLFDIDGTILWTDGAGRRAVFQALAEHFGETGPDRHEFDGKTDRQIVRELMRHAGVDDVAVTARLDDVIARYVELLRNELGGSSVGERHVYPGVRRLLDALEARDDVLLGLLTGNVREGAIAKLSAVGIDPERFKIGAFGSDHEHRPELPEIALRRAESFLGRAVAGGDVVVIGDTPADMACGRGIGAQAIGCATGHYSVEQLRACGAAAVFRDLSDTDAVMRAIMEG
jgi:phosphoglycolate phosphatase-like HAD superfamily hydrolase